ncbi:MAG: cyclopropane fatty acyl phospholipid synthase [Woeseiaceae bacterium]|nr:cyclopropane fatty acyl phospholipid synthase [Woeseiaceae bacterium]
MRPDSQRRKFESILAPADIRINGDRPWDLQVHDDRLYSRVLASGTLGAGEAYMDGWWDADALDQLICRAVSAGLEYQLKPWHLLGDVVIARMKNLQKPGRAFQVGKIHYDLGNDLFEAMLDKRMNYSCGYWADADTLDDAQTAKLDLVARKLMLEQDMRVLDIGCGWGGAARYFAEQYGVEVVGVTVSRSQLELGQEIVAGLPIELRLQDYRELNETFDRIYSIGMFEHVGHKNYRAYFNVVKRCLDEGGLFLLHTIGTNVTRPSVDPWIARYIFPNAELPSAKQITRAAESVLLLEDWHNFGPDYERTLKYWHENFEAAWPELCINYDDRFRRAWRYYLLSSAGSFRARANQLWQIVWSTGRNGDIYRPARIR